MNMRIHHITSEKVEGMPTIAEFCESSGFIDNFGNKKLGGTALATPPYKTRGFFHPSTL